VPVLARRSFPERAGLARQNGHVVPGVEHGLAAAEAARVIADDPAVLSKLDPVGVSADLYGTADRAAATEYLLLSKRTRQVLDTDAGTAWKQSNHSSRPASSMASPDGAEGPCEGLGREPCAEARVAKLAALDWTVQPVPEGPLILPDCVALAKAAGAADLIPTRRSVAERRAWPDCVVVPPSALDHGFGLCERVEDLAVEEFVAQTFPGDQRRRVRNRRRWRHSEVCGHSGTRAGRVRHRRVPTVSAGRTPGPSRRGTRACAQVGERAASPYMIGGSPCACSTSSLRAAWPRSRPGSRRRPPPPAAAQEVVDAALVYRAITPCRVFGGIAQTAGQTLNFQITGTGNLSGQGGPNGGVRNSRLCKSSVDEPVGDVVGSGQNHRLRQGDPTSEHCFTQLPAE
jgi:hypothetical protein